MNVESTKSPILELVSVTKSFGNFSAVDDVSFKVQNREFFTIVGPSGSGKTTLLRMLVGMEMPTIGDIILKGESANNIPANKRPTCMVFQSLGLFPHMTVGKNIEFPMTIKGISESERRTRGHELLRMLHLPPKFYDKKIHQCSGGEKQRVALARALAFDPEILFFDEPLSAIDARLRKVLQKELKDIQRQTNKTFIYVTHSLEEAMVMSDRVAILRAGKVEQIGTPDEIYNSPENAFVAEFMGEVNLIPVVSEGDTSLVWRDKKPHFTSPETTHKGDEYMLMVRPESIRFLSGGVSLGANVLKGELKNEFSLGSRIQYHVEVEKQIFTIERSRTERYTGPSTVDICWDVDDGLLLKL